MIEIRTERPQDAAAVRAVHLQAFGRPQEADVVDALRRQCAGMLSLVAAVEGHVVGHILFSPATLESKDHTVEGMGLAPLAVRPEHQKKGIGTALVRAGLATAQTRYRYSATMKTRFRRAEDEAKAAGRGIWSRAPATADSL